MAVGGLIGSVIGNKLSDVHGAGTIGALFGSMMAIDNSSSYVSETCQEKTFYRNKRVNHFSHYNLRVRTKRGIINIGGKTQSVYNFAKKYNKKVKKILSKKNSKLPLNQTMSLNKLLKIF